MIEVKTMASAHTFFGKYLTERNLVSHYERYRSFSQSCLYHSCFCWFRISVYSVSYIFEIWICSKYCKRFFSRTLIYWPLYLHLRSLHTMFYRSTMSEGLRSVKLFEPFWLMTESVHHIVQSSWICLSNSQPRYKTLILCGRLYPMAFGYFDRIMWTLI